MLLRDGLSILDIFLLLLALMGTLSVFAWVSVLMRKPEFANLSMSKKILALTCFLDFTALLVAAPFALAPFS